MEGESFLACLGHCEVWANKLKIWLQILGRILKEPRCWSPDGRSLWPPVSCLSRLAAPPFPLEVRRAEVTCFGQWQMPLSGGDRKTTASFAMLFHHCPRQPVILHVGSSSRLSPWMRKNTSGAPSTMWGNWSLSLNSPLFWLLWIWGCLLLYLT